MVMMRSPTPIVLATTVVALMVLMIPSIGCTNELEQFCEQSTREICARCYACAEDTAEAAELCGLEVDVDEAGCQEILELVCRSDGDAYAVGSGNSCQDAIEKISCEQLSREGKPRFCSRLF